MKNTFSAQFDFKCMCVYRGGGDNIAGVLYSVNMYIPFYVKCFELSHVMGML